MLHLAVLLLLLPQADRSATLLQQGLVALQHKQWAEAKTSLEEASKVDPENPYVWTSLAETYLRTSQPKQADEAAERAGTLGGENAVVSHALAMYYTHAGRPDRAAPFEQRYAESPQADANALLRAAALFLDAGKPLDAIPVAQKAVSQHPGALSENTLGRALVAAGRSEEGAQHLGAAWNEAKADPQICFDYAQALLHFQDFGKAGEVLEQGLKANPNNAQLNLALGVARYGQRRFEEAITAFLKTIQIDPEIEQPYLFLGRVLDQAGNHLVPIIAAYRKWETSFPQKPQPKLLLARALIAGGVTTDEPERLLRQSIVIDGTLWESHYQLGLLLAAKHDYKAAAAELNRSIELSPDQPMPHYHLARAYDRLGEPEKAKAEREIHRRLSASPAKSMAN